MAGSASRTRLPEYLRGTSVILEMYADDVDAAYQRAIDAGATPQNEVGDAFYGDRYGHLTDPFGHVLALDGPGDPVRRKRSPAGDRALRTDADRVTGGAQFSVLSSKLTTEN